MNSSDNQALKWANEMNNSDNQAFVLYFIFYLYYIYTSNI